MKITSNQWADYINKLSTLNSRGSKLVQDWIDKHGTEDVDALIDYCYKVIARYGTASAELTASMYEAIAQAEKVFIQPAELADIASYGDAAKAVQGSLLQSPSGQLVKQAVSRQINFVSTAKAKSKIQAILRRENLCASKGWKHIGFPVP